MKKRLIPFLLTFTFVATVSAQSRLVSGALEDLVVRSEDMPLEFSMAGSNAEGPSEHAAIFFRPEVLTAQQMPEGSILGVMAHLEVAADVESAAKRFDENRTAESITSSMGPDADAAQVFLDVKQLTEDVAKADATLAFRVEYELEGVHLVEYRYRLRVSNATVNLLINGRTSDRGAEPPALAAQAKHIASRQAARLASSLG